MLERNIILRDFLYDDNSSDTKILIHLANNTFLLSPNNYNDDNLYNKILKILSDNPNIEDIETEIIGSDGFVDYTKSNALWIKDIKLEKLLLLED